jgi:hypothetical protein
MMYFFAWISPITRANRVQNADILHVPQHSTGLQFPASRRAYFVRHEKRSLSCVVNSKNRRRHERERSSGEASACPVAICVILHHAAHILGATLRSTRAYFGRSSFTPLTL